MDSITQAVLGAAIGQSMLGHKTQKKGVLLGAVIATIPDLDVILYLFYDSLISALAMEGGAPNRNSSVK